ncbi:MAG: response regulator [Bradymonadaceae bacterium]
MTDRILVVEDEDDLRDSIAEVLRLQGYDVSTAANGRQGLDQLHEVDQAPSLILLDLMMPVMDGWTFRRRQLAEEDLADIPVVVFTSAKDAGVEDLDVEAVLEKPAAIERLIETVDEHL